MSDPAAKMRIHMGCGEPLKSRFWVMRAMTLPTAAEKPPAATEMQTGPGRKGRRKP